MNDIDDSAEIGLFGGYKPLQRVGLVVWSIWDASGAHNGGTGGARVFGMYPVARPLTLAAGADVAWGSEKCMDTKCFTR